MANTKRDEGFNPTVDNSERQAETNSGGMILIYLSFIFIIPIFWFIGKRNYFVRQENKINESISGIDVQLKKRRDTLIKLVDAVKGSVKFEKEVLTGVTMLRKGLSGNTMKDMTATNKIAAGINATFEAYPDLKSTANIAKLMDVSTDIEQEIAATRRLYNSYVNEWNQNIRVWPSSVIASAMKLAKKKLFAASSEDKQDVKISFD